MTREDHGPCCYWQKAWILRFCEAPGAGTLHLSTSWVYECKNTFVLAPQAGRELAHLTHHHISTQGSESHIRSQQPGLSCPGLSPYYKGCFSHRLHLPFHRGNPGSPKIKTAGRQRQPQQVAGCQPTGPPQRSCCHCHLEPQQGSWMGMQRSGLLILPLSEP